MNWLIMFRRIVHNALTCPHKMVTLRHEEVSFSNVVEKGQCSGCKRDGFESLFRHGWIRSYGRPGERIHSWHGQAFYNPSTWETLSLPIPFNFVYAGWMKALLRLKRGMRNDFIAAAHRRGYEAGKRAGVIEGRSDSYMAQASYNDLRDLARKHFGG